MQVLTITHIHDTYYILTKRRKLHISGINQTDFMRS